MVIDGLAADELARLTDREALAESLRALHGGYRQRLAAAVLAALFATWYADERLLAIWCVLAILVVPFQRVNAGRLLATVDGFAVNDRPTSPSEIASVTCAMGAVAAVSGLVWGALPLIATADSSTGWLLHSMTLVLALSAGTTLISLHPWCLLAFQAPLAIVGATAIALRGGRPAVAGAILLVAAAVSQYLIGHAAGAKARDRIRLHLRSDQLATELQQANATLAHQTRHDALTGLPNRRSSLEHVHGVVAATESGLTNRVVAALDVDRFKLVNDSFGHSVGDAVLRQLSTRLRSTLGTADFASREGGDEFLLSIGAIHDHSEAEALGHQVLDVFSAPFVIDDRELKLSGSLGIVFIDNEPGASVDDLVSFADVAMYEAKRLGRAQAYIYDRALRERSQHQLKMAEDLRHAISNRAIRLWIQPIHDLRDGNMIAAEGLARWVQDDDVLVAGAFLDSADKAGLSRDIDALMIEQAAQFMDGADLDEGFRIALNVPPRYAPWFMDQALAQFQPHHLRHVIFELTETDLAIDVPMIQVAIERVRRAGALVVLDDLGTGHSSLSLVQALPLDGIKIDQQFVQKAGDHDETAQVAVRTAVALGKQLGLAVTAEGVETELQRALMQEMGVDFAQGWFYGRAQPPETLFRLPSEP